MAEKQNKSWVFLLVIVLVLIGLGGLRFLNVIGPRGKTAIQWRSDYAAALQEAAKEDRLVLLYFFADWCPPCIKMKDNVWPENRVERIVKSSFVPVLIDLSDNNKQSPQSRLADQFKIENIPTMLILDADGSVLDQRGQLLAARDMVGFLARYEKETAGETPGDAH